MTDLRLIVIYTTKKCIKSVINHKPARLTAKLSQHRINHTIIVIIITFIDTCTVSFYIFTVLDLHYHLCVFYWYNIRIRYNKILLIDQKSACLMLFIVIFYKIKVKLHNFDDGINDEILQSLKFLKIVYINNKK